MIILMTTKYWLQGEQRVKALTSKIIRIRLHQKNPRSIKVLQIVHQENEDPQPQSILNSIKVIMKMIDLSDHLLIYLMRTKKRTSKEKKLKRSFQMCESMKKCISQN